MLSRLHPSKFPARQLFTGLAVAGAIVFIASRASGVADGREVDWLGRLARSGDSDAELQLGLAYRDGRYGLEPDQHTGLYWLTAAAQSGNAYAADAVANADADANDPNQALHWWQVAARGGNVDAQVHLGELMLRQGHDDQAASWLRKAADRGDNRAHADLAGLYRKDSLPDADLHRGENRLAVLGERVDSPSLKLFFAAWQTVKAGSPGMQSSETLQTLARHGDPVAEYQLGVRYSEGAWAVERDPQKAMTWLQRSAAVGNRVAAKTLAEYPLSAKDGLTVTPRAASGGRHT